jgi:glycosyltransferase involved in cell wall biosynthesis
MQKQGIDVHIVTCEHPGAPEEEIEDGIHIYRVTPLGTGDNFVHWVQLLNYAMYARAEKLLMDLLGVNKDGSPKRAKAKDPIILHAHDWLAHYSGAALKYKYKLPLVSTIHATERGRNSGIYTDLQRYINSVEWQLQHESWRVIVCTDFMRRECESAFGTPWFKMDVIYNGVDPSKFEVPQFSSLEERAAFRANYAAPNEKIIFYVGRMVREKGVQVLIESLPKVRWFYNDAKLLIVGGGQRAHLEELARNVGMSHCVYFTGFVPDDALMKIWQVIDVACFPSLYEPFGIVALEGMAAKVPVVVSDAGGLPEVVNNDVTGVTTYAGNPNSLADGLVKVLLNPDQAHRMVGSASERLKTDFNWNNIATQTVDVYKRVWSEYLNVEWA